MAVAKRIEYIKQCRNITHIKFTWYYKISKDFNTPESIEFLKRMKNTEDLKK